MKMNVKRILAALAVALAVPAVTAGAQEASEAVPAWPQGDSAEVYTIEQCYDLVRQNYPLVKRYELLDLTEEYTLKNAYMNYFPQISLQGSASWQTDRDADLQQGPVRGRPGVVPGSLGRRHDSGQPG